MITRDISYKEFNGAMIGLRAETLILMNYELAKSFGFRDSYPIFVLYKLNQFESIRSWELCMLMEGISFLKISQTLIKFQKRGWVGSHTIPKEKRALEYYITEDGRKAVKEMRKKLSVLKKKFNAHYVEERSRLRRSILATGHSSQ
jgi:DNA-binding HxlR family transcriptional regulator